MKKFQANQMYALWSLVKRNVKVYLQDKMQVFFSVLAPVIMLLIYILFFTDMQLTMIEGVLQQPEYEGITLTATQIKGVINNWMIAGVLGISCITVAFSANTNMVRDRQYGNLNDLLSSPIKRWMIYLSYVISCFIVTMIICLSILVIAIIFLACTGGLMMSFLDFLAILGTTVLSTLSSALFCTLFIGFIKSEGALTAINGVFAAIIGFVVGAYLPGSMMPSAINYISLFVPGSYSVALFRTIFLAGPINKLISQVPPNVVEILTKSYSLEMNFFGHTVSAWVMALVVLGSIILFGGLLLLFYSRKKHSKRFLKIKKKNQKQ